MKKMISLVLSLLMISSLFAAKVEKKQDLTNDLKQIIAKELDTTSTQDDVVAAEDQVKINDQGRTTRTL